MYYYINENADLTKGIESFNLSEKTIEKLKNNGYVKIEDLVDRRFNNILPELRRFRYAAEREVWEMLIEQGYLKDPSKEDGRIEALGFDTYITNSLRRAEIYSVDELVEVYHIPNRLMKVRRLGATGIERIRQKLVSEGLI